VTATQGSVTETREFEKKISFSGINPLYLILLRVIIGLLSLAALAWSVRVLKTQKNAGLKYRIRWRRRRNEDLLDSSRKLIASLEARILESEKKAKTQTRNIGNKRTAKKKVIKKVAKRAPKSSKKSAKVTKRKKVSKKPVSKR
jgi:ribonuclease D